MSVAPSQLSFAVLAQAIGAWDPPPLARLQRWFAEGRLPLSRLAGYFQRRSLLRLLTELAIVKNPLARAGVACERQQSLPGCYR